MLRFLHPELLWLLALIPLLALLTGKLGKSASVLFPNTGIAAVVGKLSQKNPFQWLARLRYLALALMIVALARPQIGREQSEIRASGIDIILAIDASSSMNAMDFELRGRQVRRIEAVKAAVEQFVDDRPNDRIALLMFAAKPYLASPLTLDHDFLDDRLRLIDTGVIEDGTAIGMAIASSVRRLNDREAKSKVVVLLTDGENTAGKISPLQAAETAATLGVKVYTIGAGTRGQAPVRTTDQFGRSRTVMTRVNIDEDTLTEIANMTGGIYFRATDLNELENVYEQIDELETTTHTIQGFSVEEEWFPKLLIATLIILLIEVILSQTRWYKLP